MYVHTFTYIIIHVGNKTENKRKTGVRKVL